MNCFDCAHGDVVAVAVCAHCGAGLCREHVVAVDETLTVVMPINAVIEISPPARRLRCQRCDAAERGQAAKTRRRRSA